MPRRARFQALANCVMTADPHQRIRMAMAGVACLLMVGCVVIVNLMAAAGLARKDWVGWWTLFTCAGLVVVMALIRSGRVRHWRDPSLTQLQIRFVLLCNAAAYVVAGQARGLVPIILSLVLLFGIFGMSARQMLWNVALTLLLFGTAFAIVVWLEEPGRIPALEAAYAAMTLLVLVGSHFVALRLQRIRAHLTRQKRELEQAVAQVQQLATQDELTGLPNRRYLTEMLEAEQRRSQRAGHPWMVALLDLDFFKRVNDRYGHAVGDQVLRNFATTVRRTVRNTDVLARWGGEEFLLLLQDTASDAALPMLERVRAAVQTMADTPVDGNGPALSAVPCVTVSIGVAAHCAGDSVEKTVDRADQALYQAKAQGRNRVVEWRQAPP